MITLTADPRVLGIGCASENVGETTGTNRRVARRDNLRRTGRQ